MPNYSFPFNRGDVKYKLNELVSQVCAWITQDWVQFSSFAGIEFASAISAKLGGVGAPTYGTIRVSTNGDIAVAGSYTIYGGPATIELYRNPTITDFGTEAVSTCQNLSEYEKVAHTKIYSGTTVSNDGELLLSFKIFGTVSAAGNLASTVAPEARRVLKAGEDYIIKVIPEANGENFQAFLEWAECYRIVENKA